MKTDVPVLLKTNKQVGATDASFEHMSTEDARAVMCIVYRMKAPNEVPKMG